MPMPQSAVCNEQCPMTIRPEHRLYTFLAKNCTLPCRSSMELDHAYTLRGTAAWFCTDFDNSKKLLTVLSMPGNGIVHDLNICCMSLEYEWFRKMNVNMSLYISWIIKKQCWTSFGNVIHVFCLWDMEMLLSLLEIAEVLLLLHNKGWKFFKQMLHENSCTKHWLII